MNTCGYDQELGSSEPVRRQIRSDVASEISSSEQTAGVTREMCGFYQERQTQDPSRDLSQYISLSLILGDPPNFAPRVKENEIPPDATRLIGFGPLVAKFYESAHLHQVWTRHRAQYEELIERYHQPLSKMMFDTDIYLRLPSSGYLGRQFIVYLDPMGAPSQINARVYGSNYYVVISPVGSNLKMDLIRHTYLHYVLDPLAMKRPDAMQRLAPLLDAVRTAPMEQSYKDDIALLVTECLIRAIEARTSGTGKTAEAQSQALVDKSMRQGFILTSYFYDQLAKFEKGPVGFRDTYGELLNGIDVRGETRRANNIAFADVASPDVLFMLPRRTENLLGNAENRLSAGDPEGAQKLAQQALDEQNGDPAHALFILAQAATMNRDINGARQYFQQALGVAKEPKIVAWSHIYLGRIFDIQENRDAAVDEYRAALAAANALPEAKAAAEKGLLQPYEPPVRPQPQQ